MSISLCIVKQLKLSIVLLSLNDLVCVPAHEPLLNLVFTALLLFKLVGRIVNSQFNIASHYQKPAIFLSNPNPFISCLTRILNLIRCVQFFSLLIRLIQ